MTIEELASNDTTIISSALGQALQTIRRTIPKLGNRQPVIGRDNLTYDLGEGSDWVEGFWSGQLWLAYAETSEKIFLEAANEQKAYFFKRIQQPETHDHDLGFLYSLSLVADYKLTGNQESRRVALLAAEALTARFNPAGKYIQAWNVWTNDTPEIARTKAGKIIIDCLENLALLYWAAQETGITRYYDIALAHATTAAHYLVRPDSSTFHTYNFDPVSGQPIGGSTWQGYRDDSCWSRGQAWGIHGFTLSFVYTGDIFFRDTAQRLADYVIDHLPENNLPLWDYTLDAEAVPYLDTSAAAITAAGMLLLADQLQEPAQAQPYRTTALKILNSLAATCTTNGLEQAEGLLLHGAANVPEGLNDNMLPYGDYFYLEALLRAQGRKEYFW